MQDYFIFTLPWGETARAKQGKSTVVVEISGTGKEFSLNQLTCFTLQEKQKLVHKVAGLGKVNGK